MSGRRYSEGFYRGIFLNLFLFYYPCSSFAQTAEDKLTFQVLKIVKRKWT